MRLDLSRLPGKKEVARLRTRQRRLKALAGSAADALTEMRSWVGTPPATWRLTLRKVFSYLEDAATSADVSERRLPPRPDRPAATHIIDGKGLALQLYLVAVSVAQLSFEPGARPSNTRLLRRWAHVVASPAQWGSGTDQTYMPPSAKKERALHTALDRLEAAQLVFLPHKKESRNRYEDFVLLDERGPQSHGAPREYRVPAMDEVLMSLPGGFLENGWLHLLEDSEIVLLLMIACGRGRLAGNEPGIAIPGRERLLHYGIGRDVFFAHRMLHRLGLLSVHEVARHDDGRAEEYDSEGSFLHRFQLIEAGFAEDAASVLKDCLNYQLGRVTDET